MSSPRSERSSLRSDALAGQGTDRRGQVLEQLALFGVLSAEGASSVWPEAFMGWEIIKFIWRRRGFRSGVSNDNSEDQRVGATIWQASIGDREAKPYRPDDRERRHEFSQHIGS